MATTWTHGGLFRSGTNYAMNGVCSSSQKPGDSLRSRFGIPYPSCEIGRI